MTTPTPRPPDPPTESDAAGSARETLGETGPADAVQGVEVEDERDRLDVDGERLGDDHEDHDGH